MEKHLVVFVMPQKICESRGYKYEYKQLDKDFTREDVLETFPGARTFPQIIIDDDKIGGYHELVQYIKDTGE